MGAMRARDEKGETRKTEDEQRLNLLQNWNIAFASKLDVACISDIEANSDEVKFAQTLLCEERHI